MKTYKTEVEKPKLVIKYDQDAESPRTWSNLGYFITCEGKYNSPDEHAGLIELVKQTSEQAKDTDDHMELIKKEISSGFIGEHNKVLAIYPVYRYKHGNVSYKRGTAHGFDYSNCGFYIVTDKTAEEIGMQKGKYYGNRGFERMIDQELEQYTQWANGEVYGFELYDDNGNLEDSCYGFYSIDEIKEHLPDEWENEDLTEYLEN